MAAAASATNAMPWPLVDAPFAEALLDLGARYPEMVVLSADLSKHTDVLPFALEFPDRFIQTGMAEQNMMGIAGGLSKSGLLPIAVTYGVFATRRAWDQIAMALCTGASRGIVVGFLPGITTPFRATHQATDDLALMRAIPGMVVIDPADATEMAGALVAAVDHPGTVYLRGLRGQVARIFPESDSFQIGATKLLSEGTDVGVISTGLATEWALEAADIAIKRGIRPSILHVPTLKPLDAKAIESYCSTFASVITIENHSTIGGLASSIADVISRAGLSTVLEPVGVPDRWAPGGTVEHVREALGLDATAISARMMARR